MIAWIWVVIVSVLSFAAARIYSEKMRKASAFKRAGLEVYWYYGGATIVTLLSALVTALLTA